MALMDLSTLTREQIKAMEPGPEMGRLVAEACGITLYDPDKCGDQLQEYGDPWAPYDDWNDAMLAAERFRLFDENLHGCMLHFSGGDWWVLHDERRLDWFSDDEYAPQDYLISNAQSGPLAICWAILTLWVEQRH